uniref:Uncharacterized protein n=1 Tax=Lactuca sativa TaxID=4236 RepID=A0A9R1WSL3_LACSA|nr:hypothetical protein LSAT_V11C900502560 [Lactuca sativa]
MECTDNNVPIITLTKATCDYVQWTFVERSLVGGRLTTVLTLYAEMLLHKRMQKSVWWQATKIPPPFPSDIDRVFDLKNKLCCRAKPLGIACGHVIATSHHSNINELANMVHIYYRTDVFQTVYQTQTVYPLSHPSEWELIMVVVLSI